MQRRPLPLLIVALSLVLVATVAIWSRVTGPVAPASGPPVETVTGEAPDGAPPKPAPPDPTAAKPAPPAEGQSGTRSPKPVMPPLVPGNPLDDERFAAISARIVVASVGLQHEKDWETLVLDYMAQELAKEKISPDQYNEYAEALYANPDRGRAMAENIMRRVEKKLGTRVDLKVLPKFGLDPADLEKLQQRLKE